jgi:hypothetical protein
MMNCRLELSRKEQNFNDSKAKHFEIMKPLQDSFVIGILTLEECYKREDSEAGFSLNKTLFLDYNSAKERRYNVTS